LADRNSIIEKIKALLAKTTANGCTEAEMMSALDKASAMMDAYDLTDDEVQVAKDEMAMLHTANVGQPPLYLVRVFQVWRIGANAKSSYDPSRQPAVNASLIVCVP
jgi:hypothetical protein